MKPETEKYLNRVKAAFPRLQLFQEKPAKGYEITGKFGVLPERKRSFLKSLMPRTLKRR